MVEQNKLIRLVDVINKEIYEHLLKAMQKLKVINAELESKIELSELDPNLYPADLINQLKLLMKETVNSNEIIKNIVQTTLDSDSDIEQIRQEKEPLLQEFVERLNTFVAKADELIAQV